MGFVMFVSRFCRYREASSGALNVARFATAYSPKKMHKGAPPKNENTGQSSPSSPPGRIHSPIRTQNKPLQRQPNKATEQEGRDPTSSTSTYVPFSFDEKATSQRMQDIAQSMEQISIAGESSASPLHRYQPMGTQKQISAAQGAEPMKFTPPKGPKMSRSKRNQSAKLAPSIGSGGIPNPTREYLYASNVPPKPRNTPQNLLIVIDLNGTLLYRPSKNQPRKFVARPHAQLFLKYCIETFTVVIWSSARPENVRDMCDNIMSPILRRQVTAIWGRDKFNLTQADYNERVQCYKRLERVWTDPRIAVSHPTYTSGGRWDQTNTVLIDDSAEKARSEPHNLILVPEWFGDIREPDDILPQVHDHLNHLSQHEDVSACLRARPFIPRFANPETRKKQ